MHAALGDRSLFPDLQPKAYLNHAAVSPPSLPVRAAVSEVVDDYARRGAHAWLRFRDQREDLRARLAQLVHCAPADLALVPNTSHGVLDVALCYPWRRGDRVVLMRGDFPSNVTPWQRAAATFGLEIEWIEGDVFFAPERALADLDAILRRGVRLVAVSAVQFQTGLRLPVRELVALCHRHGAELFVDAIQAVGGMPIDVTADGVDYLAAGAHKWLMGIEGAGFLYVSPNRIAALRPVVASWLSHEDAARFLFEGAGHLRHDRPIRQRADFLEIGVMGSASFAALHASVGILLDLGAAAIHAHAQAILDPLEAMLTARGFTSVRAREPALRSNILSVRPPAHLDLAATAKVFDAAGVACATPDGYLRFSPHWHNRADDVAAVADALRTLP